MLAALLVALQGSSVSMLARRHVRSTRAVTFIEYAILAAIAVVIGILFRTQLSSLFNRLFERLNGAINTN